jgi:hypothetical protein
VISENVWTLQANRTLYNLGGDKITIEERSVDSSNKPNTSLVLQDPHNSLSKLDDSVIRTSYTLDLPESLEAEPRNWRVHSYRINQRLNERRYRSNHKK